MTGPVDLDHRFDGPEAAPVLVLANSLGTTMAMWDPQVGALARRHRVLRFDHRGHGGSPVPTGPYSIDDLGQDVVALLDRNGIERASFCGVSLGGMVGMWLASHVPDRIERLVLCCTSARLGPPRGWTDRAATVRAEGTAAVAEAVSARWFTPGFWVTAPDVADRHKQMITTTPAEGYAGCCEAIANMDQLDALGAITAPTLVIAGADDLAIPIEHAMALQAGVKGSGLVVIPHAAHLANVEQPAGFAAAVTGHLDGPDPGATGIRIRREVLGDSHVDAALGGTTSLTADFQDLITRYAWGEIWSRPGLDRKTRSAITLAMLIALNRPDELAMHVRAAITNGLSAAEISEVLLQSAIYCGVPAARGAFEVASAVFGTDSMPEEGT